MKIRPLRQYDARAFSFWGCFLSLHIRPTFLIDAIMLFERARERFLSLSQRVFRVINSAIFYFVLTENKLRAQGIVRERRMEGR
ncbi:protein of unknown function [Pseudodesulfovibrio piezophilus C1TLV30]|uniref:Uncharacterized protein n=1 Tax=Pseudodesulfovibrio piezophilus (strain DSM 21447 / JCM 15486 / C1TLV30) TaxID=1322246 RepID=M1WKA9_PSEP2|nr:protein of unknown function [Pseudodesulfovibrio piezophilus C1TLV30]